MHRLQTRDDAALSALYDRYSGLVYTVARRILRSDADAEALVGDVFWELWEKADRYDAGRGSPLTYISTLARSRAIDRKRQATRRAEVAMEAADIDAPAADQYRPAPADPFNDAVLNELSVKVKDAMGVLEPWQREAVERNFFDGLSHSEIAAEMNKPLGTVKTYIRQGLIRMREAMRTAS